MVPTQNRSQECAQQLVQVLGVSAIQRILKSPRPWTDVKARANLQSPPLRIVLAEELKEMIHLRMKDGRPVGSKENKANHKKQQIKPL